MGTVVTLEPCAIAKHIDALMASVVSGLQLQMCMNPAKPTLQSPHKAHHIY